MTEEEEATLRDDLLSSAHRTRPLEPGQIRELALEIIKAREPQATLGSSWVYNYLARHPELATYWSSNIDDKRTDALNWTNTNEYFDILEERQRVCGFKEQNKHAYDETGMMLGRGTQRTRVVGPRGKKRQPLRSDDNRESLTLGVSICASGKLSMKPWIIFKGQNFDAEWAKNNSLDAECVFMLPNTHGIAANLPNQYMRVEEGIR